MLREVAYQADGKSQRRSYAVPDGNRDGNDGNRQRPATVINNHVPSQNLT
jgi:hypothetical protein